LVVENERRILVAGDLHFGIEASLSGQGIHIRSKSRERMDRLLSCIENAGPDLLLLLGDIKHSVPYTTRLEMREVRKFFEEVRGKVDLLVVPGNHDPGIEDFLAPGELAPRDGIVLDGAGYLHGHTYPNPALRGHLIVAGHHHVMLSVRDEVGCALRAPGYLLAALDEECIQFPGKRREGDSPTRVLFIPAFCELAGYDIVSMGRDPISPLSRCIDFSTSEVFLSDGTFLGPYSLLEENGSHRGP
ncbi:MAG: metallophosphoesterase, partial [Methanolinea sp.]